MISEFINLTDDERETMMKAPVLVTILIAGADNDIDRQEIRRAVGIAYAKKENPSELLVDYYNEVGQDFEDKIKVLIQQYPINASERNHLIVEELEKINSILPKLDNEFAVDFYASLRELAKKVAEASGGLLGYMAVGYEENKLMNLQMIKNPAA